MSFQNVPFARTLNSKGGITVWTTKWFFTSVHSNMGFNVRSIPFSNLTEGTGPAFRAKFDGLFFK